MWVSIWGQNSEVGPEEACCHYVLKPWWGSSEDEVKRDLDSSDSWEFNIYWSLKSVSKKGCQEKKISLEPIKQLSKWCQCGSWERECVKSLLESVKCTKLSIYWKQHCSKKGKTFYKHFSFNLKKWTDQYLSSQYKLLKDNRGVGSCERELQQM